ncbi:MAG TPA: hypothetical protein P5308_07380 [Syntrophales bacterium]|nr:hypothetical protein [Syntrophales bacterium]
MKNPIFKHLFAERDQKITSEDTFRYDSVVIIKEKDGFNEFEAISPGLFDTVQK